MSKYGRDSTSTFSDIRLQRVALFFKRAIVSMVPIKITKLTIMVCNNSTLLYIKVLRCTLRYSGVLSVYFTLLRCT